MLSTQKKGLFKISISDLLLLLFVFLFGGFTNKPLPEGFVYLDQIDPTIKTELRYYSSDNFVGDTIDGYYGNRCIMTESAALALAEVQKELKLNGYGLKIFDAYRPQSAVDHFVRWSKNLSDTTMKVKYYPDIEKNVLFRDGYISARSGHSRGSTVDLTIIYLSGYNHGQEVDMGTPWDFFSPKSWPSSDEVTEVQKSNRMLLQKIMNSRGFRPYREEWWHFTLRNEPFPETYFDFPVE